MPALIIVPSAITYAINMWNVSPFLRENRYVTPMTAKESGAPKESKIEIRHTFEDGSQALLNVIDSPGKLTPAEWASVACVFVQGNTWQFKGWPCKSPAELFTKVLGVHVRFSDEQPNQVAKGLNCTKLVLSKQSTKQHEVGVTTLTFWQALHRSMACHLPHHLARPSHH